MRTRAAEPGIPQREISRIGPVELFRRMHSVPDYGGVDGSHDGVSRSLGPAQKGRPKGRPRRWRKGRITRRERILRRR